MVAKYRETFALSGAKSDPTDAQLQSELLGSYMHKLTALFPDEPEIRALTQLTVQRRSLVQDPVNLTNKMISHLKCYFPHVLEWFEDKDTMIFCEFLIRWPTLQKAKRARKTTLSKFFNEHNSRYMEVNEKRIAQIKEATALTNDPGIIEPNVMLVEILIEQLKVLIAGIDRLEKDIARRFKAHNDAQSSLACLVLGHSLLRDCSPPSVQTAIGMTTVLKFRNIVALPQSSNPVAINHGHTGDITVPLLYGKHSLNGLDNLLGIHSGLVRTTTSNSARVSHTTLSFDP